MNSELLMFQALERRTQRREARRAFLKTAGSVTAAVGAASLLSGCFSDDDEGDPAPAPTPAPAPLPPPAGRPSDFDILNFALNLEYLEAQFYSFAATGAGLPATQLTGTGTQGGVTGGRQVNFTDPVVAQYAREIAQDERNHVAFLRRTLGASAVAQPALDIGTDPNGAFSSAARAAGLVGAGVAFDAYANDENFLLAAFIFEDVGVTAYKGASPLLSKTYIEAAAGILAAEAYHAGLIRTVLYGKGLQTPALRDATESISNARDGLDGPEEKDEGVRGTATASNIVPADANALAYSRTPGEVLNIAFLNRMAVDRGGFFPAGVNGPLRTSDPN